MKKAWKKLLATMLAGVMALSCVVTAGAVSNEDGVGAVNPDDETTPITAEDQKTELKYASGKANGKSRSEGRPGVDPVRIELPTINQDTLNMILDPYGLINRTNAARYVDPEDDTYAVSFKQNTPLYFLNSIGEPGDDDEVGDNVATVYRFTDETQTFTVTNKSHLPVGLDVTLQVNKGESDFAFVKDLASLTATADEADEEAEDEDDDADAASGALMYLALKSGEKEYAVEDLDLGEDEALAGVPTVAIDGEEALLAMITATDPAGEDGRALDNNYPKATFQWAKVTTSSEDEEGNTVTETEDIGKDIKDTFLADLGNSITVTAAVTEAADAVEADPENNVEASPAVPYSASLTISAGAVGDYKAAVTPATITNTTRDTNVTVAYAEEGEDPVAYVYFVVKAGTLDEETGLSDADAVTLTVTAPEDVTATASTHFTGTIADTENAYIDGWDADGGYYWQFTAEATEDQKAAWGYADVEAPGDDDYESISFSIIGNINAPDKDAKTSVWDGVGGDITLNLIWDVFEISDAVAATPKMKGDAPTVVVQTAASANTTQGKKLVLTWTAGTEDYANYLPSATLTLSNGSTLTMTGALTSEGNLTVSNAFTTLGSTDVTGTVTFTAEDMADYPVTVTGLRSA